MAGRLRKWGRGGGREREVKRERMKDILFVLKCKCAKSTIELAVGNKPGIYPGKGLFSRYRIILTLNIAFQMKTPQLKEPVKSPQARGGRHDCNEPARLYHKYSCSAGDNFYYSTSKSCCYLLDLGLMGKWVDALPRIFMAGPLLLTSCGERGEVCRSKTSTRLSAEDGR